MSAQASYEKFCGDTCSDRPVTLKAFVPALISCLLLAAGVVVGEHSFALALYVAAYLPVAAPLIKKALENLRKQEVFNEYTLMLVATAGAFAINEAPEGVMVMLLYSIGEHCQNAAVGNSRRHIRSLLALRPDRATVIRYGAEHVVHPQAVEVGETIVVKVGEKVPLDGNMLSPVGRFNTMALTGESIPRTLYAGDRALAGMVSIDKVAAIRVEKRYADSSLAGILEMVQAAAGRKARTETQIRRFAKVYTPIVFAIAVGIAVVPALVAGDAVFATWFYRALVFLVISCPCALVISVPLGYFGGIGAAAHNGILFKGANYVDMMAAVHTVVMDKTGTLTKGVFSVQEIIAVPPYDRQRLLAVVAALESCSNHPVAKAIVSANGGAPSRTVEEAEEIAGCGIRGIVEGKEALAGNVRWIRREGVLCDHSIDERVGTIVVTAINRQYAGLIALGDELKADAAQAIRDMRRQGVRQTLLLSGDHAGITLQTAAALGIDRAFGDLLPDGKVKHIEALKAEAAGVIAFVGDGINDAPVLALSDVGIAMGAMGADAAIESADVVIQTDQPSKIALAIRIAKATQRIVRQNIVLALSVKLLVMTFAVAGYASLWAAIFADTGVTLLAILNALRILRLKFATTIDPVRS